MIKTVKWIIENIEEIKQCEHCGSLNHTDNEFCIDCQYESKFIDDTFDRELEIEILSDAHLETTKLKI